MRRLFSRVVQLRSYRADESVQWGADSLDLAQVAANSALRRRLLSAAMNFIEKFVAALLFILCAHTH